MKNFCLLLKNSTLISGHQLTTGSHGLFSLSLYLFKLPLSFLSEKTLRDIFENVVLWHLLRSDFFSPRTSPPAAKTCQAGASQSKGVRGHQLESHPRPREPAAQLATGSGMSDFLHGVTAVCEEVTATSQYAAPFSV